MNDLEKFTHGQEGTHSVCNKHNIGDKSVCCECSGKLDCSNSTPQKKCCCKGEYPNLQTHTPESCFSETPTSQATPEGNDNDIESLSAQIHQLYCKQYEIKHGQQYWTSGDYSKLGEPTKEQDRIIARFIKSLLTQERNRAYEELIGELEKAELIEQVEYWGASVTKWEVFNDGLHDAAQIIRSKLTNKEV